MRESPRRSWAERRVRCARGRGYIVTIELLLILTILVIGTFAGCALVRNQLFQLKVLKEFSGVILRDSTALVAGDAFSNAFGKPVSYDLCEAPQILCKDYGYQKTAAGTPSDAATTDGLYALVGVRATHFVSRNRVYFVDSGGICGGGAACCTPSASNPPFVAAAGVAGIEEFLPVGAFNCGLQVDSGGTTRICYALGPPSAWGSAACNTDAELSAGCADGGRLYRSDASAAAVDISPAPGSPAVYQWTSLYPDCEGLPPDFNADGYCSLLASPPDGAYWRAAVEVTLEDAPATNVLAGLVPLFEVQPEPDLTLTEVDPDEEGTGPEDHGFTSPPPGPDPEGP